MNIDQAILAFAIKDKKFMMELSNSITPDFITQKFRWFYSAIEEHFVDPNFREIPSLNILKEKVEKEYVGKAEKLYEALKNTELDEAEFTWFLYKIKERYNQKLHQDCIENIGKIKASGEEDGIDKANRALRETLARIDSIYQKEAYKEGSLSESAEERLKNYYYTKENPEAFKGVPTGFIEIDRRTNGLHPGELMIIAGGTGCQPAGSKVLMADGTWKNVEDVVTDDFILSPQKNGSVVADRVINHARFHNVDVYKVETKDKKLSYRASYNHILPIVAAISKRKDQGKNELVELTIEEFNKKSNKWKSRARLFTTPAYDLPEKDLPLDPYFVGVMLGDGSLKYHPALTSHDKIIFDKLESIGITMGSEKNKIGTRAVTRNITGKYVPTLRSTLGRLGSKDKFVPKEYMCGSLKQRLSLLAGLIDTNGTKQDFSTTSLKLAENFRDLVFSVGGRASLNSRYTSYDNGKGKFLSYRVHYSFAEHQAPVLLEYKLQNPRNMSWKNPRNRGFEVEYEGKDTVYGFTLKGESQWYITDNYIVTHNTGKSILMSNMAINGYLNGNNPFGPVEACKPGHNILYFSLEMPKASCERRIDACIGELDYGNIKSGLLSYEDEEKYKQILLFQEKYPYNFHIVDMAKGVTPREIELKYNEVMETRFKPDLVVIDYIGIMSPNTRVDSDWLAMGKVSAELHEFARAYDVPVITGSQVNRPPKDGRIDYSTNRIARSDTISHNANIILQIASREDERLRTDMEIHIIKIRDAEPGSFILSKNFSRMKVWDLSDESFGDDEDEDEFSV